LENVLSARYLYSAIGYPNPDLMVVNMGSQNILILEDDSNRLERFLEVLHKIAPNTSFLAGQMPIE
jgi:hypothetical protein